MTAELVEMTAFVPAPEKAWHAAHKGLRVNPESRRQALLYAARQCTKTLQWFAHDSTRWATIDRLIDPRIVCKGAMFGLLIAALEAEFGPQIQARLNDLVGV